MDSFDEWKFKQNILVNGLNAKSIADMDTIPTIPWNSSQIHIPAYYTFYQICENHKNMVGRKFGKLTVMEVYKKETPNMARKSHTMAKCICECGNIKEIPATSVLNGYVQSCGCLRTKILENNKDIIGQKFGRLTVVDIYRTKSTDGTGRTRVMAKCICDCGNTKDVTIGHLIHGSTKSCGCLFTEIGENYKSMIGTKIGRYTILNVTRKLYKNSKHPIWIAECVCECGNIRDVPISQLLSGRVKSCGCYHRDVVTKFNDYKIIGDTTIVYGNNREEILVDTYVFNRLRHIKLCVVEDYVRLSQNILNKVIRFHALIVPAPEGYVVDHINKSPLDNRYRNLRVITQEENMYNRSKSRSSSNPDLPVGVSFDRQSNCYRATINIAKRKQKNFSSKNLQEVIQWRKEMEEKYYVFHPIHTEPLILPNGEFNPLYPYERYPIELWRYLQINPFVAYRI